MKELKLFNFSAFRNEFWKEEMSFTLPNKKGPCSGPFFPLRLSKPLIRSIQDHTDRVGIVIRRTISGFPSPLKSPVVTKRG
jgi:hypothetical protein